MTVRDTVTELGSLVIIEMVVFSNNRSQMVTLNTRSKAGAVTIMSSKVRVAAGGLTCRELWRHLIEYSVLQGQDR